MTQEDCSRRKSRPPAYLEKLLADYEERYKQLAEQEASARQRIEMMEAAMPALLAWNMYRVCPPDQNTGKCSMQGLMSLTMFPLPGTSATGETMNIKESIAASEDGLEKRRMLDEPEEEAIKKLKKSDRIESKQENSNKEKRYLEAHSFDRRQDNEEEPIVFEEEQKPRRHSCIMDPQVQAVYERIERLQQQQKHLRVEHEKATREARMREQKLKEKIESLEKQAERDRQMMDVIREKYR